MDEAVDQAFAGDDWYGRDLADARFVDCTFREVDLAGGVAVAESHGAVVEVPETDRQD